MVRFACPSCGTVPDGTEKWLRVDSVPGLGQDAPTVQLLIDDDLESFGSGLATDDSVEPMTTLRPCGHSFPHSTVTAVTEQLHVLDDLLERHANATSGFEIQCLREQIQSTGTKLDAIVDRCVAQMDTTCPHWRKRTWIDTNSMNQ
ncbi:hypothetical protein [Halocatena marina]|uniref:Uncharacterized protein n=1 Tax=Halocatena marina TaxID=2934937 RepID=A0ABD5YLU6_9EURY|nr:hypothetical protein [Halocatena marina]